MKKMNTMIPRLTLPHTDLRQNGTFLLLKYSGQSLVPNLTLANSLSPTRREGKGLNPLRGQYSNPHTTQNKPAGLLLKLPNWFVYKLLERITIYPKDTGAQQLGNWQDAETVLL